ncbi:Sec20-domain-containing protein [Lentinula guzmanii]|uniref:Sec20-domain-containing protein n=1 Tax=Lentinula guzmanii TaxID=2804957 RepID=A0AA38JJQ9_9AGAR|nr:Sec20-domain-containing protein [Lentinula guzmanii]
MPPLPSTFAPQATQLISSIRRREIDISDVQIPRLKICPGPLSLHQKLSMELREDMDVLARSIEDLDAMIDDQKGPKNRRELKIIVDELKQALAKSRKDYRAALLLSKRKIDTSSASNRAELLAPTIVRDGRDVNEKATEDAVMQANNNVTEALQRTLSLMQGELERSVLTTQMLDSSMSALRGTSSTHDLLTNAMDASQQLITALQKSDRMDRLLIFFGLLCFFLSVSIVLKERVLDRSVRLAFWWTRFLPSGSVSNLGSSVASEASASVSGTAILATSSSLAIATVSGISLVPTGTSIVSSASPPSSETEGSILPPLSSFLSSAIVDSTPQLSSVLETNHLPKVSASSTSNVQEVPLQLSPTTSNAHDEL